MNFYDAPNTKAFTNTNIILRQYCGVNREEQLFDKKYSERIVTGVDFKYCSPWTFNFDKSKLEANKVTFVLSRPIES